MRCPKCGFEGEGKFCANCGTPLVETSIVLSDDPVIPADEEPAPGAEAAPQVDPVPPADPVPPRGPVPDAVVRKQGIGAKFVAFWRRRKRNKVLVIIVALILISIVRGLIGGIGSPDIDTEESYDWPTNDMAQMIPEPEGTLKYVSTSNGEYLNADVDCTKDQYKTFIEGCKQMGFDKKQDVSQYEDSYDYSAENKDAFTLSADYYDGELSIYLNAPEEAEEEFEEEAVEEPAEEPEPTEEAATEKKDKSSDEVTPDFKETMDDYEAFMNDYVDFMKKYENSDDTASMLVDYGKMMTKYAEFSEKIDAIDEDELSDADYAYYMKVTGRVTEKLAELY